MNSRACMRACINETTTQCDALRRQLMVAQDKLVHLACERDELSHAFASMSANTLAQDMQTDSNGALLEARATITRLQSEQEAEKPLSASLRAASCLLLAEKAHKQEAALSEAKRALEAKTRGKAQKAMELKQARAEARKAAAEQQRALNQAQADLEIARQAAVCQEKGVEVLKAALVDTEKTLNQVRAQVAAAELEPRWALRQDKENEVLKVAAINIEKTLHQAWVQLAAAELESVQQTQANTAQNAARVEAQAAINGQRAALTEAKKAADAAQTEAEQAAMDRLQSQDAAQRLGEKAHMQEAALAEAKRALKAAQMEAKNAGDDLTDARAEARKALQTRTTLFDTGLEWAAAEQQRALNQAWADLGIARQAAVIQEREIEVLKAAVVDTEKTLDQTRAQLAAAELESVRQVQEIRTQNAAGAADAKNPLEDQNVDPAEASRDLPVQEKAKRTDEDLKAMNHLLKRCDAGAP